MDDTLIGLQTLIEIPPERIERFNRDRRGDALSRYRFLTSSLKSKWLFFSVNQHKFPGVEVTGTLKRFYPYGDILTHVIGYVSWINDRDMQRLVREEKTRLHPSHSWHWSSVLNAITKTCCTEHWLSRSWSKQPRTRNSALKFVPSVPGKDIVLNLDIKLRTYAAGTRRARCRSRSKDNGVLAMVSSPSYDPNAFILVFHLRVTMLYCRIKTDLWLTEQL